MFSIDAYIIACASIYGVSSDTIHTESKFSNPVAFFVPNSNAVGIGRASQVGFMKILKFHTLAVAKVSINRHKLIYGEKLWILKMPLEE